MMLAEVGYMFLCSILCISGVQGQAKRICALKGSSVELPCSAQHPTLGMKWYTGHWKDDKYVLKELSADGNRVTYNKSETSNFTLTINNLTESDANDYCCTETTRKQSAIQLRVADLQVKVLPTTEGQTVTLMCSTSCALTETPAVYMWYKNRESLYQDGSPWYQELVSSEEAVRYSCAIKGYEDLRAPEVSVDSVTSTCVSVTYAKGRLCKYKQTSEDKPCSITYPREVRVERRSSSLVSLSCSPSCSKTDPELAYKWYQNRKQDRIAKQFSVRSSNISFSCAIVGFEDLRSDEVCTEDNKCWSVNYVSRRICALEGSSVNISTNYSLPLGKQAISKWYKVKRGGKEEAKEVTLNEGKVTFYKNHILRIDNLERDDSAEYTFRFDGEGHDGEWKLSDVPGVTLVVTGLRVTLTPSAVVTEDQRVTLTCSTSCPLPENSTYIWYWNNQPLTPQNKQLILGKVSSGHAGKYSCAVQTGTYNFTSRAESLTVQNIQGKQPPSSSSLAAGAAAGVGAVLLVITLLTVCFCIRKKRKSHESPETEVPINTKQLNPGSVHEDISACPAEQEELHYSRVHFSKTNADPLYSNVQPHEPKDQDNVAYAVVNIRPHTTLE